MCTPWNPGALRANSAASSSLTKYELAPRTSVVGVVRFGHVLPQSVEALALADRVVAPRPGAVVEPFGVVENATPQRLSVTVRCGRDGDLQHGVEARERPLALHQRDGALLLLGHLGVPFGCRRRHVDEDQPADEFGRRHRQPQRGQPAQRHPDDEVGIGRELAHRAARPRWR